MHEYLREVVTIHKNHNHKKHFLGLNSDSILFHCVSVQLKVYSENPFSAEVNCSKKMNHFSFHASPFAQICCILEKFVKDINRNVDPFGFHSNKKLFYS